MSVSLAEQIVSDAGYNQWFVHFHLGNEGYDDSHRQRHFEFFAEHKIMFQEVISIHDVDHLGGFYHVRFQGSSDPLLKTYCETFENEQGQSLHPSSYQMFEWSHAGWVQADGPAQLNEYWRRMTFQGPQGPAGN